MAANSAHFPVEGYIAPQGNAVLKSGSSLSTSPRLLLLSANDDSSLTQQVMKHTSYFQATPVKTISNPEFLDDLLYTLNERRQLHQCRAVALLHSPGDLENLDGIISKSQRSLTHPSLCLIFTGQGAQYPGDELQCLEQYEVFRKRLDLAEHDLSELGCSWKVRHELYSSKKASRINNAEYSQPLSTILQIALVDLVRSLGVHPKVVVGHSSGEIAAAYCTGALSASSAIRVAYYRGLHSANMAAAGTHNGAMMAVGISASEAQVYVDEHALRTGGPKLTIACINSPKSVTISGDTAQIDLLETYLSVKGFFARKLNVNMAYHSPMMQAVAQRYHNSILGLEKGDSSHSSITMLSTVTGKWVQGKTLRSPQYWVDNMISPVQFSPVIENMTFNTNGKVWKRLDRSHQNNVKVTFMLEVGFHGALKGPIRDILTAVGGGKVGYDSMLVRNQAPLDALLGSLGRLLCHGIPVNLGALNNIGDKATIAPKLLCDLPEYSFNHKKSYWDESRISKRYRLHSQGKLDLLGKPTPDWNKAEAKWRNFIRVSEMPWVEDHKINGSMIYPAAGMLVMAIEAANQVAIPGRKIEGFEFRDVHFVSALGIPHTSKGVETHLYLREVRDSASSETPWSEFRLFCFENEEWVENCRGAIRVQYEDMLSASFGAGLADVERMKEASRCRARESAVSDSDGHHPEHSQLYSHLRSNGFEFGASFQLVRKGIFVNKDAKAEIELYNWDAATHHQPHIVHPCSLDAMLHLTVAALTEGGRTTIPTAIPSAFRKLWIAKDGLSCAEAKYVRATAWMVEQDSRGTEYNVSVLDALGEKVLVRGDGLRLTVVANVASSAAKTNDETQICYGLDWMPDIGFMTNQQLAAYCEQARPGALPNALFGFQSCFPVLARLLGVLQHQGRGLRMLEVGSDQDARMLTSPELVKYNDVEFRCFDPSQDAAAQGMSAAYYDIVFAAGLIGGALDAEAATQNVRSLLRDGGRLVAYEPTELDTLRATSITKSFQKHKHFLPAFDWAAALRRNGFAGIDVEFPDHLSAESRQRSVIVATALDLSKDSSNRTNFSGINGSTKGMTKPSQPVVVVDSSSPFLRDISTRLRSIALTEDYRVMSLGEAAQVDNQAETSFIFLDELEKEQLMDLNETDFAALRTIFSNCKTSLWVTNGGGESSANPTVGVAIGLFRVLRNERPDCPFATLGLDRGGTVTDSQLMLIQKVFLRITHHTDTSLCDQEYLEVDEVLCIPRLREAKTSTEAIYQRTLTSQTSWQSLKECPPIQLGIGTTGFLDTLHFTEDHLYHQPLDGDDVEIRVRASSLNLRDLLVALGRIPGSALGSEAAGIVSRVGSSSLGLSIGDRVIMVGATIRTYARAKARLVFKIDDIMSFAEASSIPTQFCTAWYTIHDLARLQRNESILIHTGAGGTGQAAIQVAQHIGATVYVTVGSEAKKQLLMREYSIPETNIFFSRNTDFAKGIMRITHGRGVDVVLNSLAGSSLVATWECIAPYGRFVEIGKKDVLANTNLPMGMFRKNTSFICFDGLAWGDDRPDLYAKTFETVMKLFREKSLRPVSPLNLFPLGKIEDAFRALQDGELAGKMILEVEEHTEIKVRCSSLHVPR
jgi:acyl transferase domain-containing protein/NADPH:quinone reductase-like Zn-dependent oxidoreductase